MSHLSARPLVRQRDVDELVQTPRPQQGPVDDVGAVGGTDDEDSLLAVHAVHLGKQLGTSIRQCSVFRAGLGVEGVVP